MFTEAHQTVREVLQSYERVDAAHAEALIARFDAQLEKQSTLGFRSEFLEIVEKFNEILSEVEDQLRRQDFGDANGHQQWLCSDAFSIADLSLSVLLHRLSCLGLESLFWNPNRPLTAMYYERVCQRDSFVRSLPPPPQSLVHRLEVLVKQMSITQVATAMSVLGVAVLVLPLMIISSK